MLEIIPAILTDNPKELDKLLAQAEAVVKRVQIDIIDGKFANNKTIDPVVFEQIETDLYLDFHLMTKEPSDWVEKAARAMADRIIGQIEMMENQVEFVAKVQEVGASVGLAIDLGTSVSKLDPVILNDLDVVLVMSVPAGFGGQKFSNKALDKIKKLNEIKSKDKTPFKICVDGGINRETVSKVVKAGADEISIGRRIFEGDLEENLIRFRKAIDGKNE